MYTRCPSCRSEISFDPPPNKDALPENYRHRIKCPSCGVTIGVKINQNPQILSQPIGRPQLAAPAGSRPAQKPTSGYYTPKNPYTPPPKTAGGAQRNPYAQPPRANAGAQRNPYAAQPRTAPYPAPPAGRAPQEEPADQAQYAAKPRTKKKAKADRANMKSGLSRNIFMMIFSLIIIAFSIISFLIKQGTIVLPESFGWVAATSYFDGISVWQALCTDFEGFKALCEAMGALGSFLTLVPLLLFTLSCANFIIAFVCTWFKRYFRVFNLLFSALIGALAALCLFSPYILVLSSGLAEADLLGYLVDVVGSGAYLAIAGAAWGVLQFIFSVLFLKSLKRKAVEEPEARGARGGRKNAKQPSQKKARR